MTNLHISCSSEWHGEINTVEALAKKNKFHAAGGRRNNNYDIHAFESALGEYIRLSWLLKVTKGFFQRAESFARASPIFLGLFHVYRPFDSCHPSARSQLSYHKLILLTALLRCLLNSIVAGHDAAHNRHGKKFQPSSLFRYF